MSTAPSTSSCEPVSAPPYRPPLTRWVPVVLWAACISWFSTDAFSAQSTHSYIDPVLRRFFGDLSPEAFRFAHAVIRKSAHFIEYGILGALMCRAFTAPGARVTGGVVVRTLVICALYASLDEVHQMFVPRRTGSPYDVLVDTVGAGVGSLLLTARRARRGDAPR